MAPSLTSVSPARIRTWFHRSPFFTRVTLFLIIVFWLAVLLLGRWMSLWGALIPSKMGLGTLYRLNTFPLVHWGLIHAVINSFCFLPLLERFEVEHGTLVSIALFVGPFATLPGLLYILIDHIILRQDSPVLGASVWVSLLLSCEAIKLWQLHPTFTIGPYKVPTWVSPLAVIFVVHVLDPNSSFLIHLCGAVFGYGFELGYLKFLVPPEKILHWIESKLDLLGRVPRYVSVEQKTYGRFGILPVANRSVGDLAIAESGGIRSYDGPSP